MLEINDMFKQTDSKHCKYCDTEFKLITVDGKAFEISDIPIVFRSAKSLFCPKCRKTYNIFWDLNGNPHPVYKKEFFECIVPGAHW